MPANDIQKKKKGIILAGGQGTRFYPINIEIPKPLIPVRKQPLINYNIHMLQTYHVDDIKIIISPEHKRDYENWLKIYGDEFSLGGTDPDIVEEPVPMGTFGFIANHLADWIGNDEVFVTNSDDIKDVDLKIMEQAHRKHDGAATIALTYIDHPDDYGTALLEGAHITGFHEKQKGIPRGLISVGVYLFSPRIFQYTKPFIEKGTHMIMLEKEIFPAMAVRGDLVGFVHAGLYEDYGTLEKWMRKIQG